MRERGKGESGWTVAGKYGFYYGSFHRTRKDAIDAHCGALGHSWTVAKQHGDYVVRSKLTLAKVAK